MSQIMEDKVLRNLQIISRYQTYSNDKLSYYIYIVSMILHENASAKGWCLVGWLKFLGSTYFTHFPRN